jgi:acyl-CoA hydrolase
MKPNDQTRLLGELRPGLSVFVQGATGEPQGLIAALKSDPDRARGVCFTAPLIPGINRFDYAALHEEASMTAFMASDAWAQTVRDGRTRLVPLSYSQTAAAIDASTFDLAVFQVTPPDADGLCSFGVSGDFPPLAWRRAKRRAGVFNPALPRPPRAETIPFDALDLALEDDAPLLAAPETPPSAALVAIAERVAALVPDGAAIQTGVGAAPAAILAALKHHRNLVIRSGLITQGYRVLSEAGAFAPNTEHVAGVAYAAADLYAWLAQADLCAFASVTRTHEVAALAATQAFTAINSALEVDLYGQANLEWRSGRQVSGVGGAPDFARAAMASRGGRSIIALPATAGAFSRIVARLTTPTVSLARHETDVIVTEHGVARLRGKTADERAEALIAIAAPEHRGTLTEAWRDLSRRG